MKRTIVLLLLVMAFLIPPGVFAEEPPPPELSPDYLSLVVRHLYRWYLDETALIVVDDEPELKFWIRRLDPKLDEGDRSEYLELLVPQLSFSLLLKKAEYAVPEMGLEISNADYRILRAARYERLPAPAEAYVHTSLPKQQVLDYLFAVRNQREYPDEALFERMRSALRDQYAAQTDLKPTGPQTVYVAPISRVSNNLWVYWENARRIIRFSSDTDLASEAFWAYEKLGVRMYDLEQDVVVSMAEAAGSNAFVTRDWAARVLFNCVVFGQRLTVMPKAEGPEEGKAVGTDAEPAAAAATEEP